jgi:hypothetical protein
LAVVVTLPFLLYGLLHYLLDRKRDLIGERAAWLFRHRDTFRLAVVVPRALLQCALHSSAFVSMVIRQVTTSV